MQEVQRDMFEQEEGTQPKGKKKIRRVHDKQRRESFAIGQSFDFTGIDFSQPQVRHSLGRAYRVLLDYHTRRIRSET